MQDHPLKKAREAKKLTMRSLASLLPLGKGGHRIVWDWEHGRAIPTLVFARSIAEHLGFSSGEDVRRICLAWQDQQGICDCENCQRDRASKIGAMPTEVTLRPEKPVSEMIAEISLGDTVISASFPEYHGGFVDVVKSLCYGWKQGAWKRKIDAFSGPIEDRAIELGYALLANGFIVRVSEDLGSKIASGDFEPERTRWITKRAVGTYAGWLSIRWGRSEDYYAAARKIERSRYSNHNVVVPPEQFEQVLDFAEMYDFKLSDAAQGVAQAAREAKESMLVVNVEARPCKAASPSDTPRSLAIPDVVGIDDELRDG